MNFGRLIYVIGPSGCGKDSVMNYARARCSGNEATFAHRYITRSATSGGENHIHLHSDEYKARLASGLFALNWESHGLYYAIGAEIDIWLEAGFNVVMNGSRAYLPEAAGRYPSILPVLITVERGILKQRLLSRGRETLEEIDSRLERAEAYDVQHRNLKVLDNSGELHVAGESLLSLVRNKRPEMKKAV